MSTGSCLGCLAHYAREYSRRFTASKKGKAIGLAPLTIEVHPDHIAAVEAFTALVQHSVITGAPAPLVPHADDVTSVNTFIGMLLTERGATPPPPEPVFDAYPMWVRIHGKEVADQMREVQT